MAVEKTYEKRGDKVYLRVIEKRKDITGAEFTVRDIEVEFDHKKHLPQLAKKLTELQSDTIDFKVDEARLIENIAAIEAAVKTAVKDTRG